MAYRILNLYAVKLLLIVQLGNAVNIMDEINIAKANDKNIARTPSAPLKADHFIQKAMTQLRQGEDVTPHPKETWCVCSRIYDPVCASNGRSYFNICQFECAMSALRQELQIIHKGNCIPFKR